jgi:hypothetical protein
LELFTGDKLDEMPAGCGFLGFLVLALPPAYEYLALFGSRRVPTLTSDRIDGPIEPG